MRGPVYHGAAGKGGERRPRSAVDLARAPVLVTWRLSGPDPRRRPALALEETAAVCAELAELEPDELVMAGGEAPWLAPVAAAVARGLPVTAAPDRAIVTRDGAMRALLDAGVSRLVLRFDAPDAERYDGAVGPPAAFAAALWAAETAARCGVPLDVETHVDVDTIGRLGRTGARVAMLGPERWRVAFVVPSVTTPRRERLGADAIEPALHELYRWRLRHGIAVETEAAPALNRIVAQRGAGWPRQLPLNDGKGLLHLSPAGDLYPSRWLPLSPGNARDDRVADVYRRSRLFRALRDGSRLEGRCARCRFRALCGGSRARAWAATGSFLAEDSGCAYRPPDWSEPPTA